MGKSTGRKRKKQQKHVAFSISGGCYFYQMGIAYFIQKHFDISEVKFSGASGGSWPATLLAAGIDVKEALDVVLERAPHCVDERKWKALGAYGVYDRGITIAFEELCRRYPNMLSAISGRLAISVTRIAWGQSGLLGLKGPFFKDEVVSDFLSLDDLVQCIIASALIPFALNGKPFVRYRDWICADGGITNVSGVRRFAAEMVEDIERMEMGLEEMVEDKLERAHEFVEEGIEQAQRFSQSFPPLHSALSINKQSSTDTDIEPVENAYYENSETLHDSAPLSSGPYGVVRLPIDIANKISAGASHAGRSILSAGVGFLKSAMTFTSPPQQVNIAAEDKGHLLSQYSSWPVPGYCVEKCHDKLDHVNDKPRDVTSGDDSSRSESEPKNSAPNKKRGLKKCDGVISENRTYWRVKSSLVSKIPGGIQLEIAPWSWRHQPLLNYHLSSDPETCRRLFEMGMVDAAEHHFDLMKFFSPEEYVLLTKERNTDDFAPRLES